MQLQERLQTSLQTKAEALTQGSCLGGYRPAWKGRLVHFWGGKECSLFSYPFWDHHFFRSLRMYIQMAIVLSKTMTQNIVQRMQETSITKKALTGGQHPQNPQAPIPMQFVYLQWYSTLGRYSSGHKRTVDLGSTATFKFCSRLMNASFPSRKARTASGFLVF